MTEIMYSVMFTLLGLLLGIIAMFIINYFKVSTAAKKADKLIEEAKKEAEKIKRDRILEAKEESHKLKIETEKQIKERKAEALEAEDRLLQRESIMDRRDQLLQNREETLEEKENNLINKQDEIQAREAKAEEVLALQMETLEKISGFSKEKAKAVVMKKVEESTAKEIAGYIKEREQEAKLEVDRKSKQMLVTTMEKYAADVANEQTVTVIALPNDDMKGRIIGREGRNIRTIEAVTGVDLIIDDTPEAIVISSFDPLRREIARITIETLIKDGRIHPARIEELYDKVSKEMNQKIQEYGEQAAYELGLVKLDPELLQLVGRLYFRTSYGQNVLQHSKEVAHLAGIMADEIGENSVLAKRAGLLHDIGKAIDHEIEGSHVEIGVRIAKKFNETDTVIDAIASHHGDSEPDTIIAVLVSIADSLSAGRPGARNDSLENYTKRLEDLENIANSFPGIDKSFAMQAGRELRVIVKPDQVDDLTSFKLARDIKDKIEKEMQYPGTVKVTLVRETRVVEEAK